MLVGVITREELSESQRNDDTLRHIRDKAGIKAVSVPDPYFLPRIKETLERMDRAQFFSTFDLARGFFQVSLEKTDREKITFLTQFGKFRFKVMPFGLRNAPATFQRHMDCILGEYNEFTNVCINDNSVFSANWDGHLWENFLLQSIIYCQPGEFHVTHPYLQSLYYKS